MNYGISVPIFLKKIKNILVVITIVFVNTLFYSCKNSDSDYSPIEPRATHFNGNHFAGSKSCASCHIDIYNTHLKTAHYNSSALADTITVKGMFSQNNTLNIGNSFQLKMILSDSSLYQQTYKTQSNQLLMNTKIDIAIGSGTKGQSYLTWKDDRLFQIQASYNTPTGSWINSPGFPTNIVKFRPVTSRCLECHTTYAEKVQGAKKENEYNKKELILGVDCEKCHGPSAKHVGFHLSNPEVMEAKHVLENKKMTRQQSLDACAICHSGIRKDKKKIPFSFITGDKLADFSDADYKKGDEINLDVHGNQYGLLSASKCFKETETMTCVTCHNPHKNERGNTKLFNNKCISCHSEASVVCKEDETSLTMNNNNCIQCHMPLLDSKSMKIDEEGSSNPVKVRTHLIDVYN